MKIALSLLFILLATAAPVLAQAECPTLVQDALALTGNACEGIGRNEVCYGHISVELEPRDETVSLAFNAPGDLASIVDVRTIRLVSMNDVFSEWGVALMKLQANLPDTLPGENVTFVLFGDVEITDAPADVAPVLPDQPPLRAFLLRTGANDARCQESPASGLLIQTPTGTGAITFNVNGVDIRLMSTAYFQAQPSGDMVISVLEGQVSATANQATAWIPPGAQVRIPLDANGVANGPPGEVVPYGDQGALSGTAGLLPLALEVPSAITDDALAAYLDSPLMSDQYGNGCVPGGRVIPILFPNGRPGDTHHITGLPAGTWHAKAGTTVTFTAEGDLSLEGDRSTTPLAYVYFFPITGNPMQSLAQSAGEETTVTYTFTQDTDFYLSASVYGSDAEIIDVTFTITCNEE